MENTEKNVVALWKKSDIINPFLKLGLTINLMKEKN